MMANKSSEKEIMIQIASSLGLRHEMLMSFIQTISKQTKATHPRLMSVEETAWYLGIAAKTLRNRIGPRAPKPFPVKCKRIGKRVLFDRKDLDKYIDSLPHEAHG